MTKLVLFTPIALILLSNVLASAQVTQDQKPPAEVLRAEDKAWTDFLDATRNPGAESLPVREKADRAREFYTTHPSHPRAVEAQKLESLYLIRAVGAGSEGSRARMETSVRAFRENTLASLTDRAAVAGSYEFHQAFKRIKGPEDRIREYEAVSRRLIQEFPSQAHGYISLLTVASIKDADEARAIASEIVRAEAAPAEAVAQAERLLRRLDLVGQSIEAVIGDALSGDSETWREGSPGLIYIWATWSPNSLRLAEKLSAREHAKVNVIGICLDTDAVEAAKIATARKLPGRLIYAPGGAQSALASKLGADAAPLLYLVDTEGHFADVHGLDNLEAKLSAIGL